MNKVHVWLRTLRPTALESVVKRRALVYNLGRIEPWVTREESSLDLLIEDAAERHLLFYVMAGIELARRRGIDLRTPERASRYGRFAIDSLVHNARDDRQLLASIDAQTPQLQALQTSLEQRIARNHSDALAIGAQLGIPPAAILGDSSISGIE